MDAMDVCFQSSSNLPRLKSRVRIPCPALFLINGLQLPTYYINIHQWSATYCKSMVCAIPRTMAGETPSLRATGIRLRIRFCTPNKPAAEVAPGDRFQSTRAPARS